MSKRVRALELINLQSIDFVFSMKASEKEHFDRVPGGDGSLCHYQGAEPGVESRLALSGDVRPTESNMFSQLCSIAWPSKEKQQ